MRYAAGTIAFILFCAVMYLQVYYGNTIIPVATAVLASGFYLATRKEWKWLIAPPLAIGAYYALAYVLDYADIIIFMLSCFAAIGYFLAREDRDSATAVAFASLAILPVWVFGSRAVLGFSLLLVFSMYFAGYFEHNHRVNLAFALLFTAVAGWNTKNYIALKMLNDYTINTFGHSILSPVIFHPIAFFAVGLIALNVPFVSRNRKFASFTIPILLYAAIYGVLIFLQYSTIFK